MKLKFTGKGGYAFENELANSKLKVGRYYTIDDLDVGSWSSTVTINGEKYNTVMFEETEEFKVLFEKKSNEFLVNYFRACEKIIGEKDV